MIYSRSHSISGQAMKVAELFGLFDDFTMGFAIVEPLRRRATN